jgi:uncharacterized protein (TIGR02996 family)
VIDRAELLRAVVGSPDDDAARLAFADWLEAHSNSLAGDDRESAKARASYIRATVARARIPIVTRPADPWASSGGFWSGDISTWAEMRTSSPFSADSAAVERQRLWDAAYPLEKQYGERWVDEDIPPTHTERPKEFQRGFVERLRISPRLLAHSPALFLDAAPSAASRSSGTTGSASTPPRTRPPSPRCHNFGASATSTSSPRATSS